MSEGNGLVLTRRPGEAVQIGDDITITILGRKGNHVKVGINAPRAVPVHRREVWEDIQREQGEEPKK